MKMYTSSLTQTMNKSQIIYSPIHMLGSGSERGYIYIEEISCGYYDMNECTVQERIVRHKHGSRYVFPAV